MNGFEGHRREGLRFSSQPLGLVLSRLYSLQSALLIAHKFRIGFKPLGPVLGWM